MATILIRHTVEDFEQWKPGFDDHDSTRKEYGQLGYQLYKGSEDPNEVVALLYWDSVENAQRFIEESDLTEVMEEVGVVGEPEILFSTRSRPRSPPQRSRGRDRAALALQSLWTRLVGPVRIQMTARTHSEVTNLYRQPSQSESSTTSSVER